jgi:uncharacterized membrane-anchored protein
MKKINGKAPSIGRQMLNKVPEITLFFWIIKVLCTTVGETAADFLNVELNLGLDGVTLVMGTILVATLVFQFKSKKYVPGIYWFAVVLISIVGTLITDNLTDNLGVPLEACTIAFAVLLAVTFVVWYKKEKTLSIHAITTTRRETFYWLAVLFTFALGTAAGDLLAESVDLGYLLSAIVFGGLIGAVAISRLGFKVNAILTFWIAYILTRPLGASIGDYLSQPLDAGGLELGTIVTSAIFLVAILATVIYLAVTKKDVIDKDEMHNIK